MTRTKLGLASKFGARYSTPLKQEYMKIEKEQKRLHECPKCGKKGLKHVSFAIWECRKCSARMAGGAWLPQTETGGIVDKIVRKGEKPVEVLKELEKTDEHETSEAKAEARKEKIGRSRAKWKKPREESEQSQQEIDEKDNEMQAEDAREEDENY